MNVKHFCLLFAFFITYVKDSNCTIFEKSIHSKILMGYNTDVRPVDEPKEAVIVNFDMRLQKLVSLRWHDPQLQWNYTEYGNVRTINLGSELIWTPDITLYNTAELWSYSHTDYYKTKVSVDYNGTAIWNAPVTWKVSCEMDITWFPVDRQTCNMTFGSNSYSKGRLQLLFWFKPKSKDEAFSSNFKVESGEWTIESVTSYEENIMLSCCPESFSTITYQLVLTRMSLYYFLYIILPLVSFAFLFLLVFHIPHDSGERMGFGVTILLSITVYLLVISEKLPEKSDVYPMLGICFIVIFYVLCGALGVAAMTTILAKRPDKPPDVLIEWALSKKSLISFSRKKKIDHKTSIKMKTNIQQFTIDDNENNDETPKNLDDNCINNDRSVDYSEIWSKICRKADKRFFIIFNIMIVCIPIVITISLPKSGLV